MTLRSGGVSEPPWSSWNLGDHVGDKPAHVVRNRQLLAERLDARPVFFKQVHGTDVAYLHGNTPDAGQADACISDQPGVACTMMVADCLPVLFASTDGHLVGAAHAGWRGLADGVLQKTLEAMHALPSKTHAPREFVAWLGPCIGPHAFEVGDEVRQAFVQEHASNQACFVARQGKWMGDLAKLARNTLQRAGLADTHIFGNNGSSVWCTYSNPSEYFSHRRDAKRLGNTGRMAACIWRS